jgi:chromosome partitioning protein
MQMDGSPDRHAQPRRAFDCLSGGIDETPSVVLHDLLGRQLPRAHVIAFANEKGGVGKSTLAFHCALFLAHLGAKVLTIDCDRRQQTLHRLLEARDATTRTLKIQLPCPQHTVLDNQSGSLLLQEIERLGRDCDFVLVDLAGHDSPIARRTIALANTVVTPVNCSPADLHALGSVDPVKHQLRKAAPFAELVVALRAQRIVCGLEPFDWVVATNRVRRCEHRLIASADRDLATMARDLGFRLRSGLTERIIYRELLPFGLAHIDLKLIPGLGRARTSHASELQQLVDGLDLPRPAGTSRSAVRRPGPSAPVSYRTAQGYREALRAAIPTGTVSG